MLTNPVTTQAANQGYLLAHPNIHPICGQLEYVRRFVLQIQSRSLLKYSLRGGAARAEGRYTRMGNEWDRVV